MNNIERLTDAEPIELIDVAHDLREATSVDYALIMDSINWKVQQGIWPSGAKEMIISILEELELDL